jgi:hypothetical protein
LCGAEPIKKHIQKRPYMDVEGDSENECFDLRDAENGSDLDESESEKCYDSPIVLPDLGVRGS